MCHKKSIKRLTYHDMFLQIVGRWKGPLHLGRRSICWGTELDRGPVSVKQTIVKSFILIKKGYIIVSGAHFTYWLPPISKKKNPCLTSQHLDIYLKWFLVDVLIHALTLFHLSGIYGKVMCFKHFVGSLYEVFIKGNPYFSGFILLWLCGIQPHNNHHKDPL